MRAYFDDNGALVIKAENPLERYALRRWWEESGAPGEHGILELQFDMPKQHHTIKLDSQGVPLQTQPLVSGALDLCTCTTDHQRSYCMRSKRCIKIEPHAPA